MHPAHTAFQEWLRGRTSARIGQVLILARERFELRHEADSSTSPDTLESFHDPFAARDIALTTDEGKFRPLKSAPTLRRGWRIVDLAFEPLVVALDCLYPAALAQWYALERGALPVTSYRDCAGRQTGMYRITAKLTDEQVQRVVACSCGERGCMKMPRWNVAEKAPLVLSRPERGGTDTIPILCPEPCSMLMSLARKVARLEQEEPMNVQFSKSDLQLIGRVLRSTLDGTQTDYRDGDFNDPRHRQRVEYFLKKYEHILKEESADVEEGEE